VHDTWTDWGKWNFNDLPPDWPKDPPKDWPSGQDDPAWYMDRPMSIRAKIPILMKPLPLDKRNKIVENAGSKEDFVNYNAIMAGKNVPRLYFCLCTLRIICGLECANHYGKTADGPDGQTPPEARDHWTSFKDPCPRGEPCPIAFERMQKGHDKNGYACDVFLKAPTSKWVLMPHPDDPKGTYPGRLTSDWR
jgi:hypothetical protein